MVDTVKGVLGPNVHTDEPLMSAGLDSLGAVELRHTLEGQLGLQLPPTLLFDYPTVDAIAAYIVNKVCTYYRCILPELVIARLIACWSACNNNMLCGVSRAAMWCAVKAVLDAQAISCM